MAWNIAAFVYPPTPPRFGLDDSFSASRAAGLAVPSLAELARATPCGDFPPMFKSPLVGEVLPLARCLRLLLSDPPLSTRESLLTTPGGYPSISSGGSSLVDPRWLPPAATKVPRPVPFKSDPADSDVPRRRLVRTEAEVKCAAPAFAVSMTVIASLTDARLLRALLSVRMLFDLNLSESLTLSVTMLLDLILSESRSISLTDPLRRRPLLWGAGAGTLACSSSISLTDPLRRRPLLLACWPAAANAAAAEICFTAGVNSSCTEARLRRPLLWDSLGCESDRPSVISFFGGSKLISFTDARRRRDDPDASWLAFDVAEVGSSSKLISFTDARRRRDDPDASWLVFEVAEVGSSSGSISRTEPRLLRPLDDFTPSPPLTRLASSRLG